jgi:prepilin-type N-terminal cleavage/methylation domain-containing protein
MNKKGFTLVEIIATIVIMAVIGLIAVPNVIKSFNNSRINSMKTQENNLVRSGDLLLEDYCKDSINEDNKDKCDMYYQELLLTDKEQENNTDFLSDEKIYSTHFACLVRTRLAFVCCGAALFHRTAAADR